MGAPPGAIATSNTFAPEGEVPIQSLSLEQRDTILAAFAGFKVA